MLQPITEPRTGPPGAGQPRAGRPGAKMTGADYMAITPPSHRGRRFQLIEGELIEMAGPSEPHQVFTGQLYIRLTLQVERLGIGETRISPYDVAFDGSSTFQPDLLFVSNARRHIFDGHGITGAPDVVVEVLSESTRRRDLTVKMPVYARSGVREVWVADLDARTVAKYAGDGASLTLVEVCQSDGVLVSDAMPGVAIELAPIFARISDARISGGG